MRLDKSIGFVMSKKIGVGVITCNRQDLFWQCIRSIGGVDTIVVVNDGEPYPEDAYPDTVQTVIQHEKNTCVGVSKNDALKYLIEDGCEHLFLVEDDVEVIDDKVFEKYIKAAEVTGIRHFNYGLHRPANKDSFGNKQPKFVANYTDDISIALYWSCGGAFSYYDKRIIDAVGFMNERFRNYWEHFEHTYRMVLKGFLPGFRWWPDIADSERYLWDLDQDQSQSVIMKDIEEFKEKLEFNTNIFIDLYGVPPGEIEEEPLGEVLENLNKIKEQYAIKT